MLKRHAAASVSLLSIIAVVSFALAQPVPRVPGTTGGAGVPHTPVGSLKIEGIPGEKPDGSIEALSLTTPNCAASPPEQSAQVGGTQKSAPGSQTLAPAPRARTQNLTFTKMADKASPKLMQAVSMGTRIPRVLVAQARGTIELEDVAVSSYKPGGGGARPVETVTLTFAKCTSKYQKQ